MDDNLSKLDGLLQEFVSLQSEIWNDAKYPTASVFTAAGINPSDGRRWLDRGVLKATATKSGRAKFLFSPKAALVASIGGRLVALGVGPSEAFEIGDAIVDRIGDKIGGIYALSSSQAVRFLAVITASPERARQIKFIRQIAGAPAFEAEGAAIVIDVGSIVEATFYALGIHLVSGGAKEFREVAEGKAK